MPEKLPYRRIATEEAFSIPEVAEMLGEVARSPGNSLDMPLVEMIYNTKGGGGFIDGLLDLALEDRAGSRTLPAQNLALPRAEALQGMRVLPVDVRHVETLEPAATLAEALELLLLVSLLVSSFPCHSAS